MKRREYNISGDLKDALKDMREETGIRTNDSELFKECFALTHMADMWLGYQKCPLPEETAHYLIGISTAYLLGKGAIPPIDEAEVAPQKGGAVAGLICYIAQGGEKTFPNLNPRLDALMQFLNKM